MMNSSLKRIGRSVGLHHVVRRLRRASGRPRLLPSDGARLAKRDVVVLDQFHDLIKRVARGQPRPRRYEDIVALAFDGLHDVKRGPVDQHAAVRSVVVDQFHRLYYHSSASTWKQTFFNGVTIWKCPLDLWLYQEIIAEIKPDLIVETGTAYGGSAYYLASLCDFHNHGRVVTIDIVHKPDRPQHPRITYINGSSVDPAIVGTVAGMVNEDSTVLVILDSDHSHGHVLAELRTWHGLVSVGSYVIVEDSNINNHPAHPRFGPGPMEAIDEFLSESDRFVVDETKHKFLMTFNPRGYLKRIR
jgi:cephalosporin hydroxylase